MKFQIKASKISRKKIQNQIQNGIFWNTTNLIVNKGLSIIVRLLLASILVPESFGIIAMAMVIVGLINILVDFGLQNALIQRKRDVNSVLRYTSAFWLLLFSGTIWTALYIFVGIPSMIWLYDEPRLAETAVFLGLNIIFHSLAIIPEIRLIRRMHFKSLVRLEIISIIVSSIITIIAAYLGAGIWALVLQQLIFSGLRTILLWHFSNWRPRLEYSFNSLYPIIRFSTHMLGVKLSDFGRANADRFIVGTLIGANALGIYSMAFLITETVRVQLSKVITRVLLPAYSSLQDNTNELRRMYLRASTFMFLFIGSVSTLILITSNIIVTTLLGKEWEDAASIIEIISYSSIIYSASGPAPELLQAVGQAHNIFKAASFNLIIVTIPLTLLLTFLYGIEGAALSVVLSMISLRARYYIQAQKILQFSHTTYLKTLLPGACTIVLIYFIAYQLR